MKNKWVYGMVLVVLLGVAGSASAELVAHWQFNEEEPDNIAYDSTTYANDAPLYNMSAANWGVMTCPPIGGMLTFNSAFSQYAQIDADATLEFGDGPFTVAFWIRIGGVYGNGGQIIHNGTSDNATASGKRYAIYTTSGRIAFDIDDRGTKVGIGNTTATAVVDTGWRHVVCRRVVEEGVNEMTIHIDGVQIGTPVNAGSVGSIDSPNEPFYIGRRHIDETPNYFSGGLADVRIYNHALSQEEIEALLYESDIAWCPNPENGQQNIGLSSDLSWKIPTDANEAWIYDVYLNTSSDLSSVTPFVAIPDTGDTVTLTNDEIGGLLASDYWWRVDADPNDGSAVRTGDVWMFNAGVALPQLVSPPDNIAIGYGLNIDDPNLAWTSDDNPIRAHSRVFITPLGGTSTDCGIQVPPFRPWDQGFQSILEWNTTYTWQVIEEDAGNNPVAVGPEWKFRIRDLACVGIFADIDGSEDCVVNFADLAVMMAEWLFCGWEEGVPGRPCP